MDGHIRSYVFGHGPLGIGLSERPEGCIVDSVAPGSPAAELGVPLGAMLYSIGPAGQAGGRTPLARLSKPEVAKLFSAAPRPLELHVRLPMELVSEQPAPSTAAPSAAEDDNNWFETYTPRGQTPYYYNARGEVRWLAPNGQITAGERTAPSSSSSSSTKDAWWQEQQQKQQQKQKQQQPQLQPPPAAQQQQQKPMPTGMSSARGGLHGGSAVPRLDGAGVDLSEIRLKHTGHTYEQQGESPRTATSRSKANAYRSQPVSVKTPRDAEGGQLSTTGLLPFFNSQERPTPYKDPMPSVLHRRGEISEEQQEILQRL